MRDLPHLASRMFGTPLMIARPKLDVILHTVGHRLLGNGEPLAYAEAHGARDTGIEVTSDGIALLDVAGTLVTRSGYLDAMSGLTSYDTIAAQLTEAMSDGRVRAVLLGIDSPGGEVGALFDLTDTIARLKDETGKPLWAVASENALSAAYAIGCCADRFYVTQTGEVGSVGVVAVHVDESGADRAEGLAYSFIYAGRKKIDGNGHQPLSDRARSSIQADVDGLYETFVGHVARQRRMSADAVMATEADTFRGQNGVAAGLVDKVGTGSSAYADLMTALAATPRSQFSTGAIRNAAKEPKMSILKAAGPKPAKKEEPEVEEQPNAPAASTEPTPLLHQPDPPAPAPAQTPLNPPEEKPAGLPPTTEPVGAPVAPESRSGLEAQLRAEASELMAVAAQAGRLGVKVDASDALKRGIKPGALAQAVLSQLAERDEATAVIPLNPKPSAPGNPAGESPIVRRAQARAAAASAA